MSTISFSQEFSASFEELPLGPDRILAAMGYPDSAAPAPVPELVQEALCAAPKHCTCRGIFQVLQSSNVSVGKDFIRNGDLRFSTGKMIAAQIKKSETICVFLTTIGPGLETISRALLHGDDPVKGYVIDTLASEATEAAVDLFAGHMLEYCAENNWKMTNRFSPGYCGWSVAEQKNLFSLFPENTCGITLSESCLMHPIKSVSGIIGLGKNVKKQPYPCEFCTMNNCIKRKLKEKGQ
ncbi:MAG: methionine synthase [Chitinivibrionales bacterium]|nr:methionine synthase [Chitinivibrionales bacterium]